MPPSKIDQNRLTGSAKRATRPISVVVVGDSYLSERGMLSIIESDRRYSVGGGAHTYEEANALVRQIRPDLLLIDPFLPNCDGVRWIADLAKEFPEMRILVASQQHEQTFAERVLRVGASGFWSNQAPVAPLMEAVNTVMNGEIYVSPIIASLAVKTLAGRARQISGGLSVLSNRELAVFSLIAREHGITRIAQTLGISPKTVETHCEHIKQKLGYPDAAALKRGARERMLLHRNPPNHNANDRV